MTQQAKQFDLDAFGPKPTARSRIAFGDLVTNNPRTIQGRVLELLQYTPMPLLTSTIAYRLNVEQAQVATACYRLRQKNMVKSVKAPGTNGMYQHEAVVKRRRQGFFARFYLAVKRFLNTPMVP